MHNKYSDILETIPPSGIRRFFDLVIGRKDIISLGVGEPDFVTPWSVREEAIYSLEKGHTSYTSNNGLLELRTQITKYLRQKFDCHYNANDEIFITVGVSEAADLALRTILNPGDEVLLPEPVYVCYSPLIKLAGGTVVSIDTSKTNFIPDPDVLEKSITPKTKAIVLCSPNNPTGSVIPKETILKIAALVKKYNLWLISDEVYAELTYDEPYFSVGSISEIKENTILLSGFSKAFAMTGWRLGYICGSKDFISRALKIHQYCMLCAPIMSQYAAIDALKNSAKQVKEMMISYKHRRNYLIKEFNAINLPTALPPGAFYCFPDIRHTGLTSEEFALRLVQEEKVAVVPGHVFGAGGEGYIRCCYATSLELLKEATIRIKRFMEKLN